MTRKKPWGREIFLVTMLRLAENGKMRRRKKILNDMGDNKANAAAY